MPPVEAEIESQQLQPKPLQDRVALVTGAARGIGRAIAVELASRGASIAVHYRSSGAEAEALAQDLQGLGVESFVVQGDISSKEESKRVVQAVMERFNQVDILVNNAGIKRNRTMSKMTDADWTAVLNTNLNGTFFCTRAAAAVDDAAQIRTHREHRLVCGPIRSAGQANYAASKGAIIAFTKTVAVEMAQYNITANVIAPGYTATELVIGLPKRALQAIEDQIPLHRLAEPQEIAKAAAFLVTDGAYITGHQLNVNGGIYM